MLPTINVDVSLGYVDKTRKDTTYTHCSNCAGRLNSEKVGASSYVATIVYLDFACLSGVFSQDEPKSSGIGGPAYTGVGYFTGVSLCGWV